MHWDSFFRQLNSENLKEEKSFLCTCREPGMGDLVHEPGRRLRFTGQCSQDKACFIIRFDSKRSLSRKLQIVSKPRKRKVVKRKPVKRTVRRKPVKRKTRVTRVTKTKRVVRRPKRRVVKRKTTRMAARSAKPKPCKSRQPKPCKIDTKHILAHMEVLFNECFIIPRKL